MDALKGRCLCGATTLSIQLPVDFVSHCHCESCRRAHGAAFVSWFGVAANRCHVSSLHDAPMQTYESSPGAFRSFCSRCGTPLVMRYTADHAEFGAATEHVYVPLAVMDEPVDKLPDSHVSFEERADWFPFSDDLPRFFGKSDELAD